jgi:pimeloyl-ACP methyl ester carboxylesterase
VVKLTDADRETLRLGCDEMHFLPVPDSGWSVALLRYRPHRVVHASFSTPCVTSPDAMWDDSDFLRGAGETHPFEKKLPLLLVPGCASNAYTFDVAPSASLARALAKEGHDVFVVECRGVGFSRPWRSPNEWADAKTNTPRQHAPTFGDFDYDTYLREDLPLACGYVAAVVGERKLGAVGHSMGGMLVMNLASGAVEETQTRPPKTRKHVTREGSDDSDSSSAVGVIAAAGEDALPWSPWEISRSVTVASCLECSDVSDGGDGHSSTYARYAAVAGIVPDYLYGGAAIPQLPLGPLSVGQGMAIEAFKGAPSERALESDDAVDAEDTLKKDTETFWERNAVSLSTCYPGATEPALVRRLLYYGFGNVPLRLVLQMATLFAPGGLATREEALARRDRAVRAAEARRRDKQSGFRRFKGWGDASSIDTDSGDATVEEVVRSSMTGSDSAERDLEKKDEKGTAKELLSHVLYLDALRARRPKLLMLAADCDPVIPPTQVAATARAGGAQYMCFGDGPKRAAGTAAPEGADLKKSDEKKRHRVDGDAALRAMLTDGGEHFSHYDLLCGRRAPTLVFPEVAKFLGRIELFGGRVEL